MKLSGNKKNGRFAPKHKKGSNRAAKILIAVLAIILAILVTFYIVLKLSLKPPPVYTVPKPTVSSSNSSSAPETGNIISPTETPVRDHKKYTFAIIGMDDGFGNTDTMMVATFDDVNYTLNIVSIPRDTLVNVSWPLKKANSFYAYGKMEGVVEGLTDLLGYRVDNYIKVDLDAFSKLVDAVGGVYFDVPKDMNYDDDSQDLHIHLKAGPQRLYGDKALQLVRARTKVWATGDIGRIETQQAFLKAAAEQIMEKKDIGLIPTLIDIFLNDVETNLKEGYLGWLAQEFFKMDAVNISFETIPAKYNDIVNGESYCTIYVDEWLDIINTKLNPYDHEITAGDVSILTRNANKTLYVTDGNWAGKKAWGSGSSASSSGSAASPSPEAGNLPGSSPDQSPNPGSDPSLEPGGNAQPDPSGEDNSPDTNTPEPDGSAPPESEETNQDDD